ncbi:hypothetical protein OXX59_000631, partial [Metschnikowia pulcherrima]
MTTHRIISKGFLRLPYRPITRLLRSDIRAFHESCTNRIINPLLPFDVLEEVENEDVKDKNEELKKQKNKLIKQRGVMRHRLKTYKSDDMPHKVDGKAADPRFSEHVTEFSQVDFNPQSNKTNTNSKDVETRDKYENSGGPPNGENGQPGDSDGSKNDKSEHPEYEPEPLEEEEPSKLRESLDKIGKFVFKCLETIGITLSSVAVLGLSGLLYHKFYNDHVLDKMDLAFQKGDPAYQLAIHNKTNKRSDAESEFIDEDLAKFWV